MNDLRFAARNLLRTPGLVLAVILTLGLGIGVNASVFSLYKAVLLDSLFLGESEHVVQLTQRIDTVRPTGLPFSAKEIADYRNMSTTLTAVEETHGMSFTLLGLDQPYRVQTDVVSAGFFDMLGVRAALGRTFRPDEDAADAAPTIVLNHKFWMEKTGGDPDIIGRSLVMNSKSHEVIGVLPPDMDVANSDVFVTTPHCPTRSSPEMTEDRDMRMMAVFARKRPGVSLTEVQAELDSIAARLAAEYPASYPDGSRYRVEATRLDDVVAGDFRNTGLLLMLVSGLILLAALANVSNLTLARATRRENELSIRAALGASRARLARLLLLEHTLLGLLGGAVGVGFAMLTTQLLSQFAARLHPLAARAEIDGGVLAYALLVSFTVGILTGLLPVLRLRNNAQPINAQLGSARAVTAGAVSSRSRDGLVVVQIALTLIVLTASLMMLRSLGELNKVQPGFAIDNVVSGRISLNPARYPDAASRVAFAERLRQRLEAVPGVTHIGFTSLMPMESDNRFNTTRISLPDTPNRDPGSLPLVDYRLADESYFDTMNIRLLNGRGFEYRDDANAPPVAIVNRRMAELFWPDENVIGRRVQPDNTILIDGGDNVAFEVIGIVDDVRQYGPRSDEGPAMYVPLRQAGFPGRVVVRTSGDTGHVKNALREAVHAIDPQQPVDRVLTMIEIREIAVESTELLALLLNIFAALVLAIAIVGIGGLIAFNVTQRLREFSIRLAVGARVSDLYRVLFGRSALLLAIGAGLGLPGALFIGRGLQQFLYDVQPADPVSILLSVVLLFAVGSVAVLVPARRLRKLQPAEILTEQ